MHGGLSVAEYTIRAIWEEETLNNEEGKRMTTFVERHVRAHGNEFPFRTVNIKWQPTTSDIWMETVE